MYAASTQIPCMYDWLLHYWQISWWVSIGPGLLVTRDTVVITQDVESRWIKNISTNKKYLPYLRCGPLSDWDSCRKPQCATGHGQKHGHCQPSAAERSRAQPRNRGTVVFQATALAVATTNTVISRTSVIASEFDHVLSHQVKRRFRTMKRAKVIFMNIIRWMQVFFWVQCIIYIYVFVYIYIYTQ